MDRTRAVVSRPQDPRRPTEHSNMSERPLILIIDDVRENRELVAGEVRSLGYRAVVADGGADGLRLARELRPSLALVDVVMPGFDGFKVAAAIKTLQSFVQVILM